MQKILNEFLTTKLWKIMELSVWLNGANQLSPSSDDVIGPSIFPKYHFFNR